MVVQQWPGSGPAHIGYGVPGGVSLDQKLNVLAARQHIVGGFLNGGTTKLLEPLRPSFYLKNDYSSRRHDALEAFLSSMDLGGIDGETLGTLEHESQVIVSPSSVDPLIGRRISMLRNESSILLYGDDNFVQAFDTDSGEITYTANMRSPVMQVDLNGLVRTRKGLAIVSEENETQYVALGDFMHVSGCTVSEAFAVSSLGQLKLFDLSTGESKWEDQRSKGTIGGWSRVSAGFGGNSNLGLWCNRYMLSVIDFREPPPSTGSAPGYYPSSSDARNLLNFEDRQGEIHDLDSGIDGKDALALTSYDIRWINGENKPRVSLIVDQPLSSSDLTKNLYKGTHLDHTLATLTSQLTPMTVVTIFGETEKLPSLLDDPYFIECWPSIIPQSHITVENREGCVLYSVGAEGGLYKQQWNEAGLDVDIDDIIDMPQPDVIPLPNHTMQSIETQVNEPRPYDLLFKGISMYQYDFSKYYDFAFGGRENHPETETNDLSNISMSHVDASSSNDFRKRLEETLIAPILRKSENDPNTVDTAVIKDRSQCVETIANDMEQLAIRHQKRLDSWHEGPRRLDPEIEQVLSLWKLPGELSDEADEQHIMSSPSSQGALSQPTQLPTYGMAEGLVSSQPDFMDIPLSQPVPTLGLSKRKGHKHTKHKHKHKKHKLREHASQP